MSDEGIESHLSDRAIEYAEEHIGKDVEIAAVAVPPVPRDKIEETVADDDYDDADAVRGHLYDLTDLTLAINHAGDPMLDHSVGDEEPYYVERDTLAEIKVARGALLSAFNRELAALADRLGIDPEQEDLVRAIRDEVEYSIDVTVDEDWETASKEDLDDALDLDE